MADIEDDIPRVQVNKNIEQEYACKKCGKDGNAVRIVGNQKF
jgi:hypothetical protein